MAPMKETSRIIIQCSNTVNKKKTLKEGKGLWITPTEDELVWLAAVSLLSVKELRELLAAAQPSKLPVIIY